MDEAIDKCAPSTDEVTYILVRITQDVGTFFDSERKMRVLKKEDVVTLPDSTARLLVARNMAVKIGADVEVPTHPERPVAPEPEPRMPKRLQDPRFRFVLVEERGKRPLPSEVNWPESSRRFDDGELKAHLANGGNYGVVCGNGLIVIDADIEEVRAAIVRSLPPTFTVRSGRESGTGTHFYFWCDDMPDAVRLARQGDKKGTIGDIKSTGGQVIGPGSVHPSGKMYSVAENRDIATVKAEEVRTALQDFIPVLEVETHAETVGRELPDRRKDLDYLKVDRVIDVSKLKRVGRKLQGSNPWHGSETGMNFSIDVDKNVWHCFRHGTGGGPLQAIAVREGIIDCADCVKGGLTGTKFKETLEAAQEKDGLVLTPLREPKYKEDGELDTKEINPYIIAQVIIDNLHIITMRDTGEMYYYHDGVYRSNGEFIVDEAIQAILLEATTNRLVGEVRGHIKRGTGYDREQLNADREWLCVRNGLLNIYTRELRPHDPSVKTTIGLPVTYDPDAKCPKIDGYLSKALRPGPEEPDGGWWETKGIEGKATPDMIMEIRKATVYEVFGYTFDPLKRLQKAALFYGPPGSGKSTTARFLAAMLGRDNISAVSLDNLTGSEFAGGAIEGKLANICSEMSGRTLKSTEALMRWVGNEDVKFERKGKDAHFAPPNINFIFTCNTTTPTSDCPSGYYRRWLMVAFMNQISESERNDAYVQDMLTDEEMSGLLNEALNGLDRIITNGKFTGAMSDESTAELYDALSDTVRMFFQNKCEVREPERTNERGVGSIDVYFVTTDELYSAYKAYCKGVKLAPVGRNRFSNALVKASGNLVYEKMVDTYKGAQRIHKKAIHNLVCEGVPADSMTRRSS